MPLHSAFSTSDTFIHIAGVALFLGLYGGGMLLMASVGLDTQRRLQDAETKQVAAGLKVTRSALDETTKALRAAEKYIQDLDAKASRQYVINQECIDRVKEDAKNKTQAIYANIDELRAQVLALQTTTAAACNTASQLLDLRQQVHELVTQRLEEKQQFKKLYETWQTEKQQV